MKFNYIDIENWNRKEYFNHYLSNVPCTYSMTVKLDITKIIDKKQKLYPTMIYYITKVVNNHNEFKISFDENGNLGFFDKMIPCYTIFHKDTETFSNLWTDYFEQYNDFCNAYENGIKKYGNSHGMVIKPDMPANNFPISMVPWTTFEGFNLNLQNGYNYLLPIFTMGKYYKENDKYIMPISIQVHHAVCDGFHLCRFINELQEVINS